MAIKKVPLRKIPQPKYIEKAKLVALRAPSEARRPQSWVGLKGERPRRPTPLVKDCTADWGSLQPLKMKREYHRRKQCMKVQSFGKGRCVEVEGRRTGGGPWMALLFSVV